MNNANLVKPKTALVAFFITFSRVIDMKSSFLISGQRSISFFEPSAAATMQPRW
jgi:hypothetical protein